MVPQRRHDNTEDLGMGAVQLLHPKLDGPCRFETAAEGLPTFANARRTGLLRRFPRDAKSSLSQADLTGSRSKKRYIPFNGRLIPKCSDQRRTYSISLSRR